MSGDGIDIGAVYQLLTHVADMVTGHDRKLNELTAGQTALRRAMDDQAAGQAAVHRAVGDQAAAIAGLRQAVTEYHASVLGHGILISEPDERVRRIELHLSLSPLA